MVTEYFKENFGAPRKIKRMFFKLQQKQQRLAFCKKIIEKKIEGKIFFLQTKPLLT